MSETNEYLVWPNGDFLLKEDSGEADILNKSDDYLTVHIPAHIEEDSEEFLNAIQTLINC